MQYLGGKARSATSLSEFILNSSDIRSNYYEPFLGGGSVAGKVGGHFYDVHYSDAHKPLILMWKAVYAGYTLFDDPTIFLPNKIGKEDYDYYKQSPITPSTAIVGFGSGFGGKYFGGFAGEISRNPGQTYHDMALRSVSRKIPGMVAKNTTSFEAHSYQEWSPSSQSVIYCDPPYEGTTSYTTSKFNHNEFWDWCRRMSLEGHDVFISEYKAPDDFICVWQKEAYVSLSKDVNSTKSLEKLFKFNEA